jgi:hypothetical protein
VDFQKGRLARDFESGHEADAIGLETMAASFAAVAVLEPEIECYRTVARHVRSISQREKRAERNQPATGELDEAREELEKATQVLCHVIRTQFEGRDDIKAISYKDRTYMVVSTASNHTTIEVLVLFQNNIPVSNVHWNKRPPGSAPNPAPLSTNGKARRSRRALKI